MIEIEYIVRDRRGVERLRTADKKAAEKKKESVKTITFAPEDEPEFSDEPISEGDDLIIE